MILALLEINESQTFRQKTLSGLQNCPPKRADLCDMQESQTQAKTRIIMRIAGVDILEKKPTWIALTQIYGIGRSNVRDLLVSAKVDPAKKAGDLTSQEVARITGVLTKLKIGGDLRKETADNIKRLKQIGSYRGLRHFQNLPVRGQRTRSNARTKRGKRVTIGAMRKKDLAKSEKTKKEKETK